MPQITPFKGSNLTELALNRRNFDAQQQQLGVQNQQRDRALDQGQQRIRLTEQQIDQAAKAAGLKREEFVIKTAREVMEESPDVDTGIQYLKAIMPRGMPPEIEANLRDVPEGLVGSKLKERQADREIEGRKVGVQELNAATSAERLEFDKSKESAGPDFKDVTSLRKEFTNVSKDYVKQVDAFGRIQASAQDPSAAGDLALIFNYMKVLDPGSTVREGEFATAQNAAGIDERLISIYNRVRSGQRLSEEQRADFVDRAQKLFQQASAQHEGIKEQFISIAERNKFDPAEVVIDFNSTGLGREGGATTVGRFKVRRK